MIRLLLRLTVCRWKGHREKRVLEHRGVHGLIAGAWHNRICTRCGATRLAKARKVKNGSS